MREESGRGFSHKGHKGHKERAENKRKNPPRPGGATSQSRPNAWSAGGRREGNTRMPLRGFGWLGDGRDSTLKSKKTASRTGSRLESGWGETTWTTWNNSFKVAGRTTPPGWKVRMERGRREKGKGGQGKRDAHPCPARLSLFHSSSGSTTSQGPSKSAQPRAPGYAPLRTGAYHGEPLHPI